MKHSGPQPQQGRKAPTTARNHQRTAAQAIPDQERRPCKSKWERRWRDEGADPPPAPKPLPDPAAPAFTGTVTSSSPAIQTDYDGLRDRVRQWAEATGQSLTDDSSEPTAPPRSPRSPRVKPAEQRNVERFVLSFPEVRDGFLRLTTAHARALFHGSPTRVECHTDADTTFPLWLEWRRDVLDRPQPRDARRVL